MTEIAPVYNSYILYTYFDTEHGGVILQTSDIFPCTDGYLIKNNSLYKFIDIKRNGKTIMVLKYLSGYHIFTDMDYEDDIVVARKFPEDNDEEDRYDQRELSEYWDKYAKN